MIYYVRPGATGNGSSPDTPRGTVPATLLPGDIVYLMGGVYTTSFLITDSGSESFPIQILPYGDGIAEINLNQSQLYCLHIQGSYVIVDGLQSNQRLITCREAARDGVFIDGQDVRGQASNVVIRGLNILDWGYVQPEEYGSAAVFARQGPMNLTVERNYIARPRYPLSGSQESGIFIWKCFGGHIIRRNDINGLLASGGFSLYDAIAGGEVVAGSGGPGYANTEIDWNTILGCQDDAIEAEGEGRNVNIHDNFIDSRGGHTNIAMAGLSIGPTRVYRNIMIGASDTCMKMGGGSNLPSTGQIVVYHNVMVSHPNYPDSNCISTSGNTPAVSNATFKNNILVAQRYCVEEYTGGTGAMYFDYNCFRSIVRDGIDCIKWQGIRMTYEQWKAYAPSMNQQAHGMYADPRMDANYELLPDSPCVDTAQPLPGYNEDFQGAAPDIGAIESPYAGAPTAQFTASPTQGYPPLSVAITDTTLGVVESEHWDFGDGTTQDNIGKSPPFTHVYSTAGAFVVRLTATGPGGIDEYEIPVTVTPYNAPIADFTATPVSGEVPLVISLVDLSTGIITAEHWDFGDGEVMDTPGNAGSFTHTYLTPGVYRITLTATGPGGESAAAIDIDAQAIPLPDVFFRLEPTGGVAPLTVQCFDESTGPITSWLWDFGDGVTSTQQHPIHVFSTAGSYTVRLTLTGPGGTDTMTRALTVNPVQPPAQTSMALPVALAVVGIIATVIIGTKKGG